MPGLILFAALVALLVSLAIATLRSGDDDDGIAGLVPTALAIR